MYFVFAASVCPDIRSKKLQAIINIFIVTANNFFHTEICTLEAVVN
jgi:hypothetical protein